MNRRSRGLISNINVVPYIDVMLVLLVIFMITAPLLSQGIVINSPDMPTDPLDAALSNPLVLSVDSEGRFYLNFGGDAETAIDERSVVERASAVLRRNADVPIFVRGDEGAAHGRVMRGFALLKQAGADQVVLVTELPEVVYQQGGARVAEHMQRTVIRRRVRAASAPRQMSVRLFENG